MAQRPVPPPPVHWAGAKPPAQAKPRPAPPPTRFALSTPPLSNVPAGVSCRALSLGAATSQAKPARAVLQAMKRKRDDSLNDDPDAPPPPQKIQKTYELHPNQHQLGANQSTKIHFVTLGNEETIPSKAKQEFLYSGRLGERGPRSYGGERPRQILRWITTVMFARLGKTAAVEVQCYWSSSTGKLWISTNKRTTNSKIKATASQIVAESQRENFNVYGPYQRGRESRHARKLFTRDKYDEQGAIYDAFGAGEIEVPMKQYSVDGKEIDVHAERRIRMELTGEFDPDYLAGVKRPCMVCAYALNIMTRTGTRPGPLWPSGSGSYDVTVQNVLDHAVANGVISHGTRMRLYPSDKKNKKVKGKLSFEYDSESESDEDE